MRTLPALPFVLSILGGCAGATDTTDPTADTSAEELRTSSNKTIRVEDCEGYPQVFDLSLGTVLTLDAPASAVILDRSDQIGPFWPVARSARGGRTRFTFTLSKSEPELYVRGDRIMLQADLDGKRGRETAQCQLRVGDARWRRVEAVDSFVGDGRTSSRTVDLGVIAPGRGLLLALVRNEGRGLSVPTGAIAPTRAPRLANGESVLVYEPGRPGAYEADAEITFSGYGTTRVHFTFEMR